MEFLETTNKIVTQSSYFSFISDASIVYEMVKEPNTPLEQLSSIQQEKSQQLANTPTYPVGSTLMRGGLGALGGLVTGFATAAVSMGKEAIRIADKVDLNDSDLTNNDGTLNEKVYANKTDEIAKEMRKELERKPITKAFIRHPKAFLLVPTAAGAGLGLYWQNRVSQNKQTQLRSEINKLEDAKTAWVENQQSSMEDTSIQR